MKHTYLLLLILALPFALAKPTTITLTLNDDAAGWYDYDSKLYIVNTSKIHSVEHNTIVANHEYAHSLWMRMNESMRKQWAGIHQEDKNYPTKYAEACYTYWQCSPAEEDFAESFAYSFTLTPVVERVGTQWFGYTALLGIDRLAFIERAQRDTGTYMRPYYALSLQKWI